MISSNERKLCLSGWLMKNDAKNYNIPLKLQKFLLFYESFSKVNGEKYDFSGLKGYKRGPVFSSVWGDYTKERAAFDAAAANAYMSNASSVNENIAVQSSFVVGVLSEDELSNLTHKMNIWSCKEDRILNGEFQVELNEKDFNSNDFQIMDMLAKMFPLQMIKDSSIIDIDDHYFVLDKKDANSLSNEQIKTLHMLCEKEELHNPIYIVKGGSRTETIDNIFDMLPDIDDEDIRKITESALEKVQDMSDEDFDSIDFEDAFTGGEG